MRADLALLAHAVTAAVASPRIDPGVAASREAVLADLPAAREQVQGADKGQPDA